MRRSSPLSVPMFQRHFLTRGRQESLRGSLTGVIQTHTSTLHLVCRTSRFNLTLFNLEMKGPSELEIRRRLTVEEEKDELTSTVTDSGGEYTETKYLLYGLDLEEQQ